MTISIGVLGAAGRMGQAIIASADAAGVTVKGGVDRVGAITGSFADAASLAARWTYWSISHRRPLSPPILPWQLMRKRRC